MKKQTSHVVVIPARNKSRRFPGKLTAKVGGVTILARSIRAASIVGRVIVAYEAGDMDIARVASEEGVAAAPVAGAPDGTDRCRQAYATAVCTLGMRCDAVINWQADEPFLNPRDVSQIIKRPAARPYGVSTMVGPLINPTDSAMKDRNTVKAIMGDGFIKGFTRVPVTDPARHHIGVYCYDAQWLLSSGSLSASLAVSESLEQLHWFQLDGFRMGYVAVDEAPPSINTPEDLKKAEQWLKRNES